MGIFLIDEPVYSGKYNQQYFQSCVFDPATADSQLLHYRLWGEVWKAWPHLNRGVIKP